MIGRMLEKIEEVLLAEKPDFVLVYGDTNSTLAGALAAKKLHIRVVHIEAGLRSFNMAMPEEINRILTDRISDILCCPTDNAVQNLRQEGFDAFPCRVVMTGDVMLDAARYYATIAPERSDIKKRLGLKGSRFVLCTVHRAENTDDPQRLSSIVTALNEISRDMRIILPLHPRTQKNIAAQGLSLSFNTIEPVGYFDMLELLRHCSIVLTDSGGLQKEAFYFKKSCITLRDETEWTELVDIGANDLAGADRQTIVSAFFKARNNGANFDIDLYGHGEASTTIVAEIMRNNC
jgi:UDP-GlcNAc3NAcA epimerase